MTPITTGITNHNYLIEAGDEAFVLRLAGSDTDCSVSTGRPSTRRAGPRRGRRGSGDLRVAPALGCLVHASSRGCRSRSPTCSAKTCSPRSWGRFALPFLPADQRGVPGVPDRGELSPHRDGSRCDGPDAYDDAHEVAARIEERSSPRCRSATCHNDLLNANFLPTATTCGSLTTSTRVWATRSSTWGTSP